MPHRHCKTCRSPLHADETQAECVSCLGKSHADAALSGTDCFHCESFSLASLRSWIAFFSESDSAPRALPFSSCQGPVKKKQRWQRIRAAGYKQAHVSSMPVCLTITTERAFTHPIQSIWSASLRGCEQHDLELTKSWRAPYSSRICPSAHISWRRWRERIQAPAPSGWVPGCASLPVHGCWMKGVGEPSVQTVQSHICTRWTCLLCGWTSGFGAAL